MEILQFFAQEGVNFLGINTSAINHFLLNEWGPNAKTPQDIDMLLFLLCNIPDLDEERHVSGQYGQKPLSLFSIALIKEINSYEPSQLEERCNYVKLLVYSGADTSKLNEWISVWYDAEKQSEPNLKAKIDHVKGVIEQAKVRREAVLKETGSFQEMLDDATGRQVPKDLFNIMASYLGPAELKLMVAKRCLALEKGLNQQNQAAI